MSSADLDYGGGAYVADDGGAPPPPRAAEHYAALRVVARVRVRCEMRAMWC